jgi:hypothetical protein
MDIGRGKSGGMEKRSQGSLELLMLIGITLLVVSLITAFIALTAQGLGADIGGEVDDFRDNVVLPALVGAVIGIKSGLG